MQETAFAKINLALHVRGREPDRYHRIETLFAFAEDGDLLSVFGAEELSVEVTGPFAADLAGEADNLVLRAAHALRERFGVRDGAALVLDKRLPVASGIGGGSADAAAALRLLSRFWGLEHEEEVLLGIAAGLGADVPACLLSRTVRGEGRGDRLKPAAVEGLSGAPLLLVNPRKPLSTAAVFGRWDGVDGGPLADFMSGRNDLEEAAISLCSEINEVLDAFAGAPLARMSGSGATCFAIYQNGAQRDAAAARIAAAHPSWWRLATRVR